MTQVQEFKKQFIWRDDARINAVKEDYERVIDKYNSFFLIVEKALNITLSDVQKISISQSRDKAIIDILKPDFPFPKADDAFNLQAMGLNINSLLSEARTLHLLFSKHELKNGNLVLTDDFINEITENATIYTANEKQNKALELAKNFEALFDEAEELGVVSSYNKSGINNIIKILDFPLGSSKITLSRYGITDIRE
ncbi:hypothetical protein [Flavobacterium rhizosphaerae]|uniref:Uncharacterized protein n=1 Tax=Flavobacterium rhizosphaerae TaxID=3163298 RepID=A0ABW8Z117_9FLAO